MRYRHLRNSTFTSDEHSVGIRWIKYVQKLENMFVGMSVESKKRKKALRLHYAGDEVFIHDTLPDTGGESDYDQTKRAWSYIQTASE